MRARHLVDVFEAQQDLSSVESGRKERKGEINEHGGRNNKIESFKHVTPSLILEDSTKLNPNFFFANLARFSVNRPALMRWNLRSPPSMRSMMRYLIDTGEARVSL